MKDRYEPGESTRAPKNPHGDEGDSALAHSSAETALRYEPNPKHKTPWQPGRKGTMCPAWSHKEASSLLTKSVAASKGGKRYATAGGTAFCGQEHSTGVWHGYPITWMEVPPVIRNRWIAEGTVTKRQVGKSWDAVVQGSDE